jgi:predicted transcriptional regulator
MLDRLPAREREVVDAVFALKEAGAEEIRQALSDPPSNSAVRAMLSRLEAKGFVRRRLEQHRYLYSPGLPEKKARESALTQVVRTFFNGSPAGAATALLGMSERLEEAELDQLEQMIARARQENAK